MQDPQNAGYVVGESPAKQLQCATWRKIYEYCAYTSLAKQV